MSKRDTANHNPSPVVRTWLLHGQCILVLALSPNIHKLEWHVWVYMYVHIYIYTVPYTYIYIYVYIYIHTY